MSRPTRSPRRPLTLVDTKSSQTEDFSDPESQAVLDAVADALIGPLALQAARDDHEDWLATQKVRG